jgi:tRNA(Phe) wybutosine-synthesizing methylase Tyw3
MCKWGTYKRLKLLKPKKYSKRKFAYIDSCIFPIVKALNKAKIETLASCCGHNRGLGSIMLVDGRELLIAQNRKIGLKIGNWFYKDKIKKQLKEEKQ